jgi:hypothetical protein
MTIAQCDLPDAVPPVDDNFVHCVACYNGVCIVF